MSPIRSPLLRRVGLFVLADLFLILGLAGLGLVLGTMRVSSSAFEKFSSVLSEHGVIFGLVLPVSICLLILGLLVWVIVWAVAVMKGS